MSLLDTLFGGSTSSSTNNSGGQSFGQNQNFSNGLNLNFGTNQSANESSGSSSSMSSGESQSTSLQDVWGEQAPFLQGVFQGSQNAFDNFQGQLQALQPQVQDQLANSLDQAQGGVNNQMTGGFSAGLQGQVGPNAYVNPLAADMMSDAAKIKQQNLGALDARAAAAGMSGSSGYRNQVSDMQDNVDEQTLQGLNQLRFNAQNQGVANQMNLANMMDQRQQFGVGNLQNLQQGAMNQFNPAMMGQQSAALHGQTIGGPTVLGESQSTSSNMSVGGSKQESNGFSNGMNIGFGMNQGMGFGNNFGSNIGSGASNGSTQNGIVPGIAQGVAAFTKP